MTATVSSADWDVEVVDMSLADLWWWRLGQYLGQTSGDGGLADTRQTSGGREDLGIVSRLVRQGSPGTAGTAESRTLGIPLGAGKTSAACLCWYGRPR